MITETNEEDIHFRCYDNELMYDMITLEDTPNIELNKLVIKFNNLYSKYSDINYLLNDPLCGLDTTEYGNKLKYRFEETVGTMSKILTRIHNIILKGTNNE